jgi:hypothetical protein
MLASQILSGPRSKIKRANRHIDELRERTTPLDRTLYEITNRRERETVLNLYPNRFQVTFRPKENIPDALAAIIGDTVGNLREALDHLASGIVRQWGTSIAGALYFPVTPRKDLIAHTGLAAIEQALPGSKKLLLEEIRPDDGPNEHFWDFYTLNKDDKHNFFIPTVTVGEIRGLNANVGGNIFNNCLFGFNAARPQIIFDSPVPIAISNNFDAIVDVKFGEGTPFKDEPVIPTITQISEVVAEAINAFGRLIDATKG